MEGGLITLFAGLLLTPILIWVERQQRWRTLDPLEQQLRRASEGFGLISAALAAVFLYFRFPESGHFVVGQCANFGGAGILAAVTALLLVLGYIRFAAGWRRCAGVRDGLKQCGAVARFAAGVVLTVYFARTFGWIYFGPSIWACVAERIGVFAGFWLIVVGAVRFAALAQYVKPGRIEVEDHERDSGFSWDEAPPRWRRFIFTRRNRR
jgi:hypothetical protein